LDPAIASQSLMDDDEDVPTTVAMRDQIDVGQRGAVRPAAGLPAPGPAPRQPAPAPSPASYAANAGAFASRPPQPAFGGRFPAGAASYAANAGHVPSAPLSHFGEHTTTMNPEDLGSTVALPMPDGGMSPGRARFGPPAPSFGAPPTNGQGYGYNMGFGQGGPAPTFGQPPANPALTPAGLVGGVPMNLPMGQAGQPQSQIETALSLPRPDPAALWLAQQEKQKGERRNTGVLIAVVALTALCVLGIGALAYFKLRARAHGAVTPDAPTAVDATASAAPAGSSSAAGGSLAAGVSTSTSGGEAASTTSASAQPSATASASASAQPPPAATTAIAAAGTGQASVPKPGKEEPGFLTIVCNPYCDDVLDQGRSLGPSPVVHLSVPPGQHRVTLRKGKDSKVISVIVVSGQVTAQRVSMK
jgi:serine/threonine-protein kinase